MKIVRLTENELPKYETSGSSCFDIRSNVQIEIPPKSRSLIPTGLLFQLDEGFEAQIRPRSGLAIKYGITVLNSPGTIDSDYRGEIKVILYNTGEQPFYIMPGDRIAQCCIIKVEQVQIEEVNSIDNTERGNKGFGSTGVK